MLEVIGKQHTLWLKYLNKLGCQNDCEDIVQEMYIKIYNYLQKYDRNLMYNDEEVNYYFVYVTLQNLYYDTIKKKKPNLTELEDIEVVDEEYVEVDITKELDAILKWYNSDDNDNVAGKEYYRRIFEEIFIERKPVSELSRESTITYWSLRNAVKIIKKQIQELL